MLARLEENETLICIKFDAIIYILHMIYRTTAKVLLSSEPVSASIMAKSRTSRLHYVFKP